MWLKIVNKASVFLFEGKGNRPANMLLDVTMHKLLTSNMLPVRMRLLFQDMYEVCR